VDAAGLGHLHLLAERLVGVQAVEAEVARHARLVVAAEARHAARHVGPLGEALAPPLVVLGEGVELREVVGEQLHAPRHVGAERLELLELGGRLGEALHLARDGRLVVRHAPVHARLVAAGQPVGEGIFGQVAAQVALGVEAHVEGGGGVAALLVAVGPEVQERIDAGRRHVGAVLAVIVDVEIGHRAEPPGGAVRQPMRQRAFAGREAIALAVPGRIEERARAAAFGVAVEGVVVERLQPAGGHVRVARRVPERVEVRVRATPLGVAVVVEVVVGVDAGVGDVGVALQVVAAVEQVGPAERRLAGGVQHCVVLGRGLGRQRRFDDGIERGGGGGAAAFELGEELRHRGQAAARRGSSPSR